MYARATLPIRRMASSERGSPNPIVKKIYNSFFPADPSGGDPWFKVKFEPSKERTLFGTATSIQHPTTMRDELWGSKQWVNGPTTHTTAELPLLPPKLLIKCTLNNIFLELSAEKGNVLWHTSAGCLGFKNAQKTTNKTALAMMDALWLKLSQLNITKLRVDFRGVNPARQILLSQLKRPGLEITEIMDTTPKPFNGPRPKKARRV